jgi:hypothetical protein
MSAKMPQLVEVEVRHAESASDRMPVAGEHRLREVLPVLGEEQEVVAIELGWDKVEGRLAIGVRTMSRVFWNFGSVKVRVFALNRSSTLIRRSGRKSHDGRAA